MSKEGARLLDQADWIIESTALLPGTESVAFRTLTISLDEALQQQASQLVASPDVASSVAEFFQDAVDVDLDIHAAIIMAPSDGSDEVSGFEDLIRRYLEVAGLRSDDLDLVGVIEELRIPDFASQPRTNQPLGKWVKAAREGGEVIFAVGTLAGAAHVAAGAGAVLAVVAPPAGAAVLLGSVAVGGGIYAGGRVKQMYRKRVARRKAEKEAKARQAAERQRAEDEARRRQQAQQEEQKRAHDATLRRQAELREHAPHPHLTPSPEGDEGTRGEKK